MTDDYQVAKLTRRLERVPRIAQTMHRIADSRFADDHAKALHDHANLLADIAADALALLRAHHPDAEIATGVSPEEDATDDAS